MLLESKRVKKWLKQSIMGASAYTEDDAEKTNVSFNPMPALIIFLLGMMMGGHEQHQMVSTMVHKQWGSLLSGAAMARGVTYVLTYIKPPTSHLPARPPSELIGSFCLISGGLIFMLSVSTPIHECIKYKLTSIGIGYHGCHGVVRARYHVHLQRRHRPQLLHHGVGNRRHRHQSMGQQERSRSIAQPIVVVRLIRWHA